MYVGLIYCQDADGVIGVDGEMPWYCKSEMEWFKAATLGSVVVMGRKTWESLPNGPLKGRKNIVLTRDKNYQAPGAFVYTDHMSVLKDHSTDSNVFAIGGSEILKLYEPYADFVIVSTLGLRVRVRKESVTTRFTLGDEWVKRETSSGDAFKVSWYSREESLELPTIPRPTTST